MEKPMVRHLFTEVTILLNNDGAQDTNDTGGIDHASKTSGTSDGSILFIIRLGGDGGED
jgi:hypothetical protein